MDKETFGWVYIIENKNNGLYNVGKAINYKKRMRQHLHSREENSDHLYFDRTYQKYGPDAFWHWKLPCKSKEEMIEWERYFIRTLNSISPYGYNLTTGGEGGDTFTNNPNKEKTRKKMKKSRNHYYQTSEGKKRREEHSERMTGPNHPNFGKEGYWIGEKRPDVSKKLKDFYQTLEGKKVRKEMSERRKGKNNPRAREVILISPPPETKPYHLFHYKDFCLEHNLSNGHISQVLKGKRNHHHGWTGYYLEEKK